MTTLSAPPAVPNSSPSSSPAPTRLSRRVQKLLPSATVAISGKCRALKSAGHKVFDFSIGEPQFDTPQHIRDAAVKALNSGWTHYIETAGPLEVRKAISEKLRKENNLSIPAENICISAGGKQSYFLLVHALFDTDCGLECVLPTPSWLSYKPIAELAGAKVIEVASTVENDFKITPDQLRAALTPRSRLLVMNSPNNPCGTMYAPAELKALGDVVNEHNRRHPDPGLVVVTDEIYEKLLLADVPFAPFAAFVDPDRCVTINGLSKSHAMTGWRIGYAAGPAELIKAMTKLQGQMTTCVTAFCCPAITQAILHGEADALQMRDEYRRRADVVFSALRTIPGLRCPRPTGAFYLFPDVSAYFGKKSPSGKIIANAIDLCSELLERHHVALVPGDDFGPPGHRHVRLCFAADIPTLTEGASRIRDFIASLS